MASAGKKHPPKLVTTKSGDSEGDVLVGTGLRSVKLGFVEIQVYELGLYVDAPACRSVLLPAGYGNVDRDGLLRNKTFFSTLASGKFRKTFRLVFCRSLSKDKMTGGFAEPLRRRVDEYHGGDADELLSKFVPGGGVAEGDVLMLTCLGDGETVRATFLTAGEAASGWGVGSGTELVSVKSGGEGGAWLGFQNIFFDDETQIPTIRVTAVADLPDVLVVSDKDEERAGDNYGDTEVREGKDDGGKEEGSSSEAAPQQAESSSSSDARRREPSVKEIEAAIDTDFVKIGSAGKGGNEKKTWSDFAGRNPKNGGDGYKFGDFTLGVVTAMGLRKPDPGTDPHKPLHKEVAVKVAPPLRKIAATKEDEDDINALRAKVAKLETSAFSAQEKDKSLQKKAEKLEVANAQLRRACEALEDNLINIRRSWPLALVGALTVSELTGFALVHLHGMSPAGLSLGKLVLCAILGVALGVRYQKLTEQMGKTKVE